MRGPLAGLVPLALGFVAGFIGLGGLTTAVRGQMERVRGIVDKLGERLLDKVMKLAAKVLVERHL